MHVVYTSLSTWRCPLGFKTLLLGKAMDEETAERIFDQSTLTGFYKTEIRPCKAMCKRTQQLPKFHVAKRLTGFKLCATTQQHATTCNRVCKRT